MSDKIDIANLRLQANNLRTADQTDAFIDLLLDHLEAERQRADKANRTCSDLLRTATDEAMRANKAETELSALRGTQEPDHYRYSCGSCGYETLAYTAKCPTCNYHKIEEEPLFTRQPKPVVVLPAYRCSPDMHTKQYFGTIGFNLGLDASKAASEATGIVVKDGE